MKNSRGHKGRGFHPLILYHGKKTKRSDGGGVRHMEPKSITFRWLLHTQPNGQGQKKQRLTSSSRTRSFHREEEKTIPERKNRQIAGSIEGGKRPLGSEVARDKWVKGNRRGSHEESGKRRSEESNGKRGGGGGGGERCLKRRKKRDLPHRRGTPLNKESTWREETPRREVA